MTFSHRLPRIVRHAGAVAALAALAACSGSDRNSPPAFGGGVQAPLVVDCLLTSDTVITGSSPILVLAHVTRGNQPVAGATVSFAASRGLTQPAAAVSDAQGMATVQFTPPGTAGLAQIAVNATDRSGGDVAASSCTVNVVAPRNPRVNVQLIVPDNAAGLEIRVLYDPSRVTLPAGGARAAGAFAGSACLPLANDDGVGLVELDIACSSMQSGAGNVATFDFTHLAGSELTANDFTVACSAFDEQGRSLGAACAVSVTQL